MIDAWPITEPVEGADATLDEAPVPQSAMAELPSVEVTAATLAKILRCGEEAIRKYAQVGIIQRSSQGHYPLYESVGAVVEHLRGVAGNGATADAMKAGAALKAAQRRLVEMRAEKLDGTLISLPDVEALWGDLVRSTQTLFRSFPSRARFELPQLTREDVGALDQLCATMLRELALQGATPPLPTGGGQDIEDDDRQLAA